MTATGRAQAFPLVDIVRGCAALSVLVFHLIAHWEWEDGANARARTRRHRRSRA